MIHVAVSTGHSTAAGNRVNCHLFFPQATLFSKNKNVKVKVKYGYVLYTGLSFALYISQIGNQNMQIRMNILWILHDFWIFFIWENCLFTKPWGMLEKLMPFYFRINTSYLKMSGMSFCSNVIIILKKIEFTFYNF